MLKGFGMYGVVDEDVQKEKAENKEEEYFHDLFKEVALPYFTQYHDSIPSDTRFKLQIERLVMMRWGKVYSDADKAME